MSAFRIRTAVLTAGAAIGLAACTTPFGYGGVGVGGGYGSYGYDGYGYGYPAGAYGYGYEPYYGWYDGYYYPGTGYYVYDRYRNPYPWDHYKDYWEGRRENAMSSKEFRRQMEAYRDQQNWTGFDQGPSQVQRVQRVRSGDRTSRVERTSREQRVERSNRSQRVERSSSRSEKSSSRKQSAAEFRRSMENRD